VPLSQAGAELLFEAFSQRYERGSTVVTSDLPLGRMDKRVRFRAAYGCAARILEMNGDSYRLNQSKRRSCRASADIPADNPTHA
jgi:DNA replication protein DnaC